jgi:predicted tellurium resistance membrane protein TerC
MKFIVLVAFSILGIYGISLALSADSTLNLVIGILLSLMSFTTAILALIQILRQKRRQSNDRDEH